MTGKKIVRIETVSSNIILPLSMTALHYFAPLKIGEADAAGVPYRPLIWAMPNNVLIMRKIVYLIAPESKEVKDGICRQLNRKPTA